MTRRLGRIYSKGQNLWSSRTLSVLALLLSMMILTIKGRSSLSELFLLVSLSQSWNLIGGLTGYSSLGQVAFFGLGAYFAGISIEYWHFSFPLALGGSALVAIVFAVLVGVPLLRLRGPYFAIATLVASLGTFEAFSWISSVMPGGDGVTITTAGTTAIMKYPTQGGFALMYLTLATVATVSVALVVRSRHGGGLRLIKENEALAAFSGINTRRYKVVVFAFSGVIAALAGGVYGFQQVTLDPNTLFNPRLSIAMVAMVLIGGSGTVFGPIFGALVVTAALELVANHSGSAQDVVVAAITVLGVLRQAETFPPPSGPAPGVLGADPTSDPQFVERSFVVVPRLVERIRTGSKDG